MAAGDLIQAKDAEIATRPRLKITNLHLKGLGPIRSLDLPQDGLGWEGEFPDMVLVGGVNGSGKTRLLEFIAGAIEILAEPPNLQIRWGPEGLPRVIRATEAIVDFRMEVPGEIVPFRFLVGKESFFNANKTNTSICYGYTNSNHLSDLSIHKLEGIAKNNLARILFSPGSLQTSILPGVVFFPGEGRTLTIPKERHKAAGLNPVVPEFVSRWRRPKLWKDSFEATLYHARWIDLNAKEEGETPGLRRFDEYCRAFERFFQGSKKLRWVQGELRIELKNGTLHDLTELSSGEKQIITLMGELLARWRPGSLILIDEPELHLHPAWQARLWDALSDWRQERGGQVILATQSNYLFQISDPGTQVLLGGEHLA